MTALPTRVCMCTHTCVHLCTVYIYGEGDDDDDVDCLDLTLAFLYLSGHGNIIALTDALIFPEASHSKSPVSPTSCKASVGFPGTRRTGSSRTCPHAQLGREVGTSEALARPLTRQLGGSTFVPAHIS